MAGIAHRVNARHLLIAATSLVASLISSEFVQAQENKKPDRVGGNYIEGNVDTPDWAILPFLDMYSGQPLDYSRLESARKAIRRSLLFDPGSPPSVELLPNEFDSQFKDIAIRIRERPWNWALFAIYEVAASFLTLDARLFFGTACRVKDKLGAALPVGRIVDLVLGKE